MTSVLVTAPQYTTDRSLKIIIPGWISCVAKLLDVFEPKDPEMKELSHGSGIYGPTRSEPLFVKFGRSRNGLIVRILAHMTKMKVRNRYVASPVSG